MKIPKHISEYLIANPPEEFNWQAKGPGVVSDGKVCFVLDEKRVYRCRAGSEYSPENLFDCSITKANEFCYAANYTYMCEIWYKQIEEICEQT